MPVVINPLSRAQYIRVNKRYDNQDVVVENLLSQKRKFRDLPYTDQLTQNSWNWSTKTREDNFEDIIIGNPRIVGRAEKARTPQQLRKYRESIPTVTR